MKPRARAPSRTASCGFRGKHHQRRRGSEAYARARKEHRAYHGVRGKESAPRTYPLDSRAGRLHPLLRGAIVLLPIRLRDVEGRGRAAHGPGGPHAASGVVGVLVRSALHPPPDARQHQPAVAVAVSVDMRAPPHLRRRVVHAVAERRVLQPADRQRRRGEPRLQALAPGESRLLAVPRGVPGGLFGDGKHAHEFTQTIAPNGPRARRKQGAARPAMSSRTRPRDPLGSDPWRGPQAAPPTATPETRTARRSTRQGRRPLGAARVPCSPSRRTRQPVWGQQPRARIRENHHPNWPARRAATARRAACHVLAHAAARSARI